MRLLAKCQHCLRIYNATQHEQGKRFHCRCGATIVVPSLNKGHHRRIIRCSSCGAPSEQGATACAYCQASFTLHEKDMFTVCPHCMTRVSDHARFCHSCGNSLYIQEQAGSKTSMHCPACKDQQILFSRSVRDAGINFLECETCTGIWLEHESFNELQRQAQSQAVPEPQQVLQQRKEQAVEKQSTFYRKCPHCSTIMNRNNFAKSSGIIIDICSQHGIWFDHDELARILDWIRSGSHKIQQEKQKQWDRLEERARESMARITVEPQHGQHSRSWENDRSDFLSTQLSNIISKIFNL